MSERLDIAWCADPGRTHALAKFFADHVRFDPSYISHSELQGPRALSPTEWVPNLEEVLAEEIGPRLEAIKATPPSHNSKPILSAELDGELVAISFVTFDSEFVPFAVIEDLVVTPSRRSRGIGSRVIEWIAGEARKRDIRRLMLESGTTNHRAHELFHRAKFEVCSQVMMRTLD